MTYEYIYLQCVPYFPRYLYLRVSLLRFSFQRNTEAQIQHRIPARSASRRSGSPRRNARALRGSLSTACCTGVQRAASQAKQSRASMRGAGRVACCLSRFRPPREQRKRNEKKNCSEAFHRRPCVMHDFHTGWTPRVLAKASIREVVRDRQSAMLPTSGRF